MTGLDESGFNPESWEVTVEVQTKWRLSRKEEGILTSEFLLQSIQGNVPQREKRKKKKRNSLVQIHTFI